MVIITPEVFYEELSKAIFSDLKAKLLTKQRNHCLRVDYLPAPVMNFTCEKLNTDADLKAKEVEGYVLTDKKANTFDIESGRLIELRNRLNFGILVVFIPQGFRGAAEDSYDIHTFESYDLAGVLNAHKYSMINAYTPEDQKILKSVLENSSVRKQRIENQLRYLLAIKNDQCSWESAGAYLHYLNLIPDLKLKEEDVQFRLWRNLECVEQLRDYDKTIFLSIDNLVNKGLDPNHNSIKTHLLNFFRVQNQADVSTWAGVILHEPDWLKKISFDKWRFKDLAGDQIEVYLEPFRDKNGELLAYSGLTIEGDNLMATTNTKLKPKWKTNPRRTPNVSQFILILEREEESDSSDELLRKTSKGTSEQVNFPLSEIDLEKGEEWLVHIRILALDENKAKLAEDVSEPFYIRGEDGDTGGGGETKRFTKIRNIAEATLKATYRFRKEIEIESQGWEPGRKLLYRIKTVPRDTFQISLNDLLYELELKTLQDPLSGGVWDVNIINRGYIELSDFHEGKFKLSAFDSELSRFMNDRRELFHAITSTDESAVIEVLDLRPFQDLIISYANSFQQLTDKLTLAISESSDATVNNILNNTHFLNRLDTVLIKLGTTEEPEELILMAPTHPLKMLWLLQYQLMLYNWSSQMIGMTEDQIRKAIDIEGFEKILPLNVPNAISFEKDSFFVNTDVLDLYWSIFPKSTTIDIRKVIALISKALGYRDDLGNISSVTPAQIADRLWRYLRHHPYIKTLKLNVLNPGDGLLFLNTIRELQKMEDFKELRYDITFYGSLGYELMGNAFDNLMNDSSSTESRPEIDEELLEPSHNPLFPKLFFSKVRVNADKWSEIEFKEANVTILIDQFVTKTVSRPVGNVPGSYFLHGLLAEYRSEFSIMNDAVTWSRKVVPSLTSDVSVFNISELIFKIGRNILGTSCSYFDWGKSCAHLPTIQLELGQQDKYILSQIHDCSDWVFTIDRNFGIEYFDNPGDANPNLKSYLIDYTPEFMDGVGHRLIVSTGWVNEIEKLIEDGLKKINIPTSSFRAIRILDIIKSVSGKLALKLINNPNSVREIIGLAITRLALERDGLLENAVLIPVDTHIDIFAQNKRRNVEEEVTVKRSDLILVSAKAGKLNFNLIEVKFRSGEGSITESLILKEEILKKNENSEKAFRTKFISDDQNPKIDVQLSNKSLSTLIGFYMERAIRNGFFKTDDSLLIEDTNLKSIIESVNTGNFEINFEKSGYIIHWAGITKPIENYKGNQIYELGNDVISQLLEIRQTEIEDELPSEEVIVASPTEIELTDNSNSPIFETSSVLPDEEIKAPIIETITEIKPVILPEQPPIVISNPSVVLGKNVDTGKDLKFDPFTLTPKKLANQHLLIVGKSGAGKSQTTSSFLYELNKQQIPFLILDFQGEYISSVLTNASGQTFLEATDSSNLDPSYGMDINPLELSVDGNTGEKIGFMSNVYQVSGILKQIFGLGDIQHPLLKDAIKRAYHEKGFSVSDRETWNNVPPNFQDIWSILEFMEQNEGANVRNLKYRVEPLFENNIFITGEKSVSIGKMLEQNSIINLSTLHTPELMKSVARFVLQGVYNRMLAEGPSNKIKLYVVIDEAHKLSYDQTLTDLIRESRKYGVGFILASQSVRDFATVVFENMGTKIALQLEGEDAKFMAENFGATDKPSKEAVLSMLPSQKPMRALIRNNHFEPFAQVDIEPFFKK